MSEETIQAAKSYERDSMTRSHGEKRDAIPGQYADAPVTKYQVSGTEKILSAIESSEYNTSMKFIYPCIKLRAEKSERRNI